MPKVPHNRAVVVKPAGASKRVDPAGRVDVLLLRVGELLTRKLERALGAGGISPELWDGPDGVQSAIQQFCDEKKLTGLVASPVALAHRAGLIGKRKKGAV